MVIDEQNQNNRLLEESTFLEVWGAGSPVHPSFRPPRRLGRFAGKKRPKRRVARRVVACVAGGILVPRIRTFSAADRAARKNPSQHLIDVLSVIS